MPGAQCLMWHNSWGCLSRSAGVWASDGSSGWPDSAPNLDAGQAPGSPPHPPRSALKLQRQWRSAIRGQGAPLSAPPGIRIVTAGGGAQSRSPPCGSFGFHGPCHLRMGQVLGLDCITDSVSSDLPASLLLRLHNISVKLLTALLLVRYTSLQVLY